MREFPVFRRTLAAITGYNRPFASLKEAEAAISGYAVDGHANPACAMNLLRTMQVASPSDYAALYCLQPILPRIRTIFDFGGSIGNLFYCYSKYLAMPADLTWTVYDLPANVALGEKIALESGNRRLRFTSALKEGDGADLLLATGVLHYFEKHLPELIAEFKTQPRYILVNRTPLVDGRPFATVQDAGVFRVACVLHNRGELIQSFSDAGYELVDSWRAAERSLLIPCYPDRSVTAYSGMFFRLRDNQPAPYEENHSFCS